MSVAIVWFRRDLRLADHEALSAACRTADRVAAVYVHDPASEGHWAAGAASRWWLHHSLQALSENLRRAGSRLIIRRGDSATILSEIARQTGAAQVFFSHIHEPSHALTEQHVEHRLHRIGVSSRRYGGALLHEPEMLLNSTGAPYRVFTPFWKACQRLPAPGRPLPAPAKIPPSPADVTSLSLVALELLPKTRWDVGLATRWQPGEQRSWAAAEIFLQSALATYPAMRDIPAAPATSRLSAALHFGEVTPRQLVWQARAATEVPPEAIQAFIRQLGWREFAHYLLHHFPDTADQPLDRRFKSFAWRRRYGSLLRAWQEGETGIPLVDAGMRELWHTGWMHNRVRMVAASFLTKNLRIPWQEGARWFWDTLVDADLANNTMGWQWIAGCGADAAPYFRIFNPAIQGRKFDSEGDYVRHWIPALERVPDRWLHQPWDAPDGVLSAANVRLGVGYPLPVVDLATSRREALDAYDVIKDHKRERPQ